MHRPYGAERNRQMRPRFERMVERWTPCCLPGVYEGYPIWELPGNEGELFSGRCRRQLAGMLRSLN